MHRFLCPSLPIVPGAGAQHARSPRAALAAAAALRSVQVRRARPGVGQLRRRVALAVVRLVRRLFACAGGLALVLDRAPRAAAARATVAVFLAARLKPGGLFLFGAMLAR